MKTTLASTLIALSATMGLVSAPQVQARTNPGTVKNPPAVRPSQQFAGQNSGVLSANVATQTTLNTVAGSATSAPQTTSP